MHYLYLIEDKAKGVNTHASDCYDSCVVVARDNEEAIEIAKEHCWNMRERSAKIHFKLLGQAIGNQSELIISSFNAA